MHSHGPDKIDWRTHVRARLKSSRLHAADVEDMVEEVAQHLESQYVELALQVGAGEARDQLLAQLRDQQFDDATERRRERAKLRPTRSRVWSSTSLLRDLRHGSRAMLRSPGTLIAGIAALALGIGLTTMMYSVIYGMLIKGLPFDDASRIAMIYYLEPGAPGETLMSFDEFAQYRAKQHSFETVAAYTSSKVTIGGGDAPERADAVNTTSSLFEVTRTRALLGRTFTSSDNEPGAPPTAVLSYALWRDRYASDKSIVGKFIRVNGREVSIVGVAPESFVFPVPARLWLSLQRSPVSSSAEYREDLFMVGKLKPALDYERANVEFSAMSRQLLGTRAKPDTTSRAVVQPFLRAMTPNHIYKLLYTMLGAVFLVLLVACANVANLLLNRAASRTREIAFRTALGASRLAVIRQSLVESFILAAAAAVIGAAIAQIGIIAFNRALVDIDHPFWIDIQLHPPVLLFVLGLVVISSLVSGLLPAIQSSRLDVNALIKDESHAASVLRAGKTTRVLVVAEIAMSSAMLLAAVFATKTVVNLRNVDVGFDPQRVLTARLSPASQDTAQQRTLLQSVERALRAIPGSSGVYLGTEFPGTGWGSARVTVDGREYHNAQDHPTTRTLSVSPGFFDTYGVRILRGRAINELDRAGALRVAVVSEAFVRRVFPDSDPLGQRVRVGDPERPGDWLTIVGVMPTIFAMSMTNPYPPEIVASFWQRRSWTNVVIAVRGSTETPLAETMKKAVAAVDPDTPLFSIESMNEALERPQWPFRVFGSMFAMFGIVALVLAAIGLYAVMAFSTSRRMREMGIRMALGATSGNVIRLVCRQGALQIAIGMSIGLIAGAGLVQAARAILFQIKPSDPATFVLVAVVLGAAALIACLIPAIGATRVDPVIALRVD